MNGHIDEARSNDYVEGILTEDSTREVEAHLATCAECTAQVEGLRSLLADLADLPTEAAPSRGPRPTSASPPGPSSPAPPGAVWGWLTGAGGWEPDAVHAPQSVTLQVSQV